MFLADILMIMVISGIFVSRLQIVDTRSELMALTVLLGLGIKSLFLFLLIVFKIQPALGWQLILTAGTLLAYLLWLWSQSKLFSSVVLKFKSERFLHTKTFKILGVLFTLGIACAIYFPITGADGIWYHVKGMVYFHEARFDSERIISQFRQYPPMIGLLYAWFISGGIEQLPIIFPVLYFCLLIVVFHRLWGHLENSHTAALGTLVLGTTPYLWWHSFLPFLDWTAGVFYAVGILYWFSLVKNFLDPAASLVMKQNRSLALLSGFFFGLASWTRPEFFLYSILPFFLLVCAFDRQEKFLSERNPIIIRFAMAAFTLPSLWFLILLNFNGPLDTTFKQLIMGCVCLWIGLGLVLFRVVRFSPRASTLIGAFAVVICLAGLFIIPLQDFSPWTMLAVRFFRLFAVQIFFAGTVFLFVFIFIEKLRQLPLAEKNLGVLLLLFILMQALVYAYSGLKWPTLSHYIENTFFHPGNSINLSDTRGTLAIYPAFVFFIFCFNSIRNGIESGRVRRFLFIIIGVNLVIITAVFAGPRVKFIADNLGKSYEERAENSGPSDMPNQFSKTYRVAHQLKKHVVSGQFLLLPPGNREGSFRSVMTQVLFSQRISFADDSKLRQSLEEKISSVYEVSKFNDKAKSCNELERVVLGETGFILCKLDKF